MTKHDQTENLDSFHDDLTAIEPILLRDPLVEALGALTRDGVPLVYAFTDVVKMEGHACPTTACAYECCRVALDRLYPGKTPVRGEIEITVYGAPDDGVYGVFGHVLGFITGAAPETGFKGLGTMFRRKDLLTYDEASPDPEAMCFRFRRTDNGKAVLCRIRHEGMPPRPPDKAQRMSALISKVLWEAAKPEEVAEFRRLWLEGVMLVFESAKKNEWLTLEEVK